MTKKDSFEASKINVSRLQSYEMLGAEKFKGLMIPFQRLI